jgi:hypothetical protein
MSISKFNVFVFIGEVIMCLTWHWPIICSTRENIAINDLHMWDGDAETSAIFIWAT